MSIVIIIYVCYAILQSILYTKFTFKATERDNYVVMVIVYAILAPAVSVGIMLLTVFMILRWLWYRINSTFF